jgi:hypothetical protein
METQVSHERDGRDQQEAPGLVWRKKDRWFQETRCGQYRIEKFATGLNVATGGDFRYRALKWAQEWWFEISGSESNAATAKQACADHAAAQAESVRI